MCISNCSLGTKILKSRKERKEKEIKTRKFLSDKRKFRDKNTKNE